MSLKCSCEHLSLDSSTDFETDWSEEEDDVTICGEQLSIADYSETFYSSPR